MKRIVGLFVAVVLVAATFVAANLVGAQNPPRLRLAAGSPGGTYYAMSQDTQNYCAAGVNLHLVKTTGADDSIDKMYANDADVGVVQFDMLFKRKKGGDQDVQNLLMVMPLHPESAHFIALEKSGVKNVSELGAVRGGWFGSGAKPAKKVGAWGGSVESAEIISALTALDFPVVAYAKRDDALTALKSGEVEAVVAMGGFPMDWITKELSRGTHRLLTFDLWSDKVGGAYSQSTLTYARLGASAIPTIATSAVLVSRNFPNRDKVLAVSLLKKCIQTKLVEMQGADDTHGAWRNVKADVDAKGWTWFPALTVEWPAGSGGHRKR